MTKNLDKNLFRKLLIETLKEDKDLFKNIILDVLKENPGLLDEIKSEKRKRLEQIIKEDFEEYSEVFKALA